VVSENQCIGWALTISIFSSEGIMTRRNDRVFSTTAISMLVPWAKYLRFRLKAMLASRVARTIV